MAHEINSPEVIAEVRDSFDRYNAALDTNDVDGLNGFFWDAPHTVRFGIGENLFGHDAIATFRTGKWKAGPPRRLAELAITTFGRDYATTNAVFEAEGRDAAVRQSQTWVRFPVGWRIVAAHVSTLKRT